MSALASMSWMFPIVDAESLRRLRSLESVKALPEAEQQSETRQRCIGEAQRSIRSQGAASFSFFLVKLGKNSGNDDSNRRIGQNPFPIPQIPNFPNHHQINLNPNFQPPPDLNHKN
ncbi:hypothetical protein LINPERHAP2_LOCUS3723 [Linum perenne]